MIPLRFRRLNDASGKLLFTTDAGRSFLATEAFLENYVQDGLAPGEREALGRYGPAIDEIDALSGSSYIHALARRHQVRLVPDYFILVPTLRCNLSCSYCQVSRADEKAAGFDWTPEIAEAAIRMIKESPAEYIKLEFQGGEPTLRLDLVKYVIESIAAEKERVESVICTNLAEISPAMIALLDRGDVFISTSIDGGIERQARQRTNSGSAARDFFKNVDWIIERYGTSRISALPTIDVKKPPMYEELYDAFVGRGLHSLFLRPINFQGFARKRHADSRAREKNWSDYYKGFIRYLIERGPETDFNAHEFYFVQLLKRIFRAGENGHVDLRNPSLMGVDYLVIDYDGRLYPTDEARMLERVGEIDLSIGDVFAGVDRRKARTLNEFAFNDDDPDCVHCAFQPYCGSDLVDSISRYGRADIPRGETVFCASQTDFFDFAFSMLADPSEEERKALSRWLDLPQAPARFLEALQ